MKEKRTYEFVGAIIGAIIGLVIVNSVPVWRHMTHGVVLESWANILWAANISIIVHMIGNTFLAIYRPARVFSFIQAIMAMVGLVSVIVFYRVFPLDFSQVMGNWLNILFKGMLVLGIIGTGIAILVHLVKAIDGTQYTQAQIK
jgi:hypothetical protein